VSENAWKADATPWRLICGRGHQLFKAAEKLTPHADTTILLSEAVVVDRNKQLTTN
jgi:hypothetical protein